MNLIETDKLKSYHAHIYYNKETEHFARSLRNDFEFYIEKDGWRLFRKSLSQLVKLGAFHHTPIGPHPQPMFQITFKHQALHFMLFHLIQFRYGLDILIHPETGSEYRDHTNHAVWLGNPVALDLSKL